MSLPLSICMIVKNEASCLAACLQSVQDLAGELIVVDTGSTDNTIAIAQQFGAKVLQFPWNDDFAEARNRSLEAATQPWILVLDADETFSDTARASLQDLWNELDAKTVYSFPLYVQGQGSWAYKQYLFANDPQLRYSGRVHEQILLPSGYRGRQIDHIQVDHWSLKKGKATTEEKSRYYATLLEQRLQEDPTDLGPHVFLAWHHLQHRRFDQALIHAQTAIDHLPRTTNYRLMAHLYAGMAHFEQGNWDQALAACQAGLDIYADYPELHALQGLSWLNKQAWNQAEQSLLRTAMLASRPVEHGIVADSALRPPAIFEPLSRVYEGLGQDLPARICRALYKKSADYPHALNGELRQLLQQKQWRAALWFIAAFYPVETGSWGPAAFKALTSGDRVEQLLTEADLWSMMQAFGPWPPQVKKLLETAAREFPLDPRPWQRLADWAIRHEAWADAVGPLDKLLKLDPQSGWSWNALGIAQLMMGNPDQAATCFTRTIRVGTPEEAAQAKRNLAQLQETARG